MDWEWGGFFPRIHWTYTNKVGTTKWKWCGLTPKKELIILNSFSNNKQIKFVYGLDYGKIP